MSAFDHVDWNGLLNRARGGDPRARDELCRDLQVRLRPILQSRLWGWSRPDLDDILQNTMLTVIEKLNQMETNPHFFALNVLRNKIGDALRASRSHRDVAYEEATRMESDGETMEIDQSMAFADPDGDFSKDLDAKDLTGRIRDAIPRLSKFCQSVFLSLIESRPLSEVWELYQELEPDLKRSAFDKRVFDCRKRLREQLRGTM